jgi:hypothetical protein
MLLLAHRQNTRKKALKTQYAVSLSFPAGTAIRYVAMPGLHADDSSTACGRAGGD